jgi:hypothetical protein
MDAGYFKKDRASLLRQMATQAKSDSTLDPKADWMFDACSAQMDSTFKPLLAGINPATKHGANPKM